MVRRVWKYASNNPLIAGLLIVMITSGSAWAWLPAARAWLSTYLRVMRGAVVLLALLLFIALAVIYRLATALRRERACAPAAATPNVDSEATPQGAQQTPQVPVSFTPETFELTPPRCRALLALYRHIDQRVNLHELYSVVAKIGPAYMDTHTDKGDVEHDMDKAEGAGLVRVDRIGTVTKYYNLTPEWRDWVRSKKTELEIMASKGMARRDLRAP
jgi:hypothetical protein